MEEGDLVWYDVPGAGLHPAIIVVIREAAPPVVVISGTSSTRRGPGLTVKANAGTPLGYVLSNDTTFHYGDFRCVEMSALKPWRTRFKVDQRTMLALRAALVIHPPK